MKKKTGTRKAVSILFLMCVFLMFSTVTVSAGTNVLTSAKQAREGSWHRDKKGRKYVYKDGLHPKSRWLKIKGKYYSFDTYGYVETGWKTYNGKKYYLSKTRGKEGQLLLGMHTIKGKTYYFAKSTGELSHGWQILKGKKYYFGMKTGAMHKNEWVGGRYVSSDGSVTKLRATSKSRLIVLGDCRTEAMVENGIGTGSAIYIAKSSMGYDWLRSTAGPLLQSYLATYPESTVIFCFGLNDYLYQQARYIDYYRSFIASYPDANIYLMSLNLVIGVGAYNVCNDNIKIFNDALRSNFPKNYMDCYSYLEKAGYYAADGQHYDVTTYRKIYDYIIRTTGWVS